MSTDTPASPEATAPTTSAAQELVAYEALAKDVLRICSKRDVVNKYGATDWDNLDPRIRDRGFWVAVPRDRFERRRAYLA